LNSLYGGGHDDLFGFGGFGHSHSWRQPDPFSLGPQVTLDESGALSPISTATGHTWGHHSSSTPTPTTTPTVGTSTGTPTPTLVSSSSSNLSIDLVWDASVAGAPSGFTAAVTAAVQALVNDLSTPAKTELFVGVGWGEVNGQSMAANALGQSNSTGYLTSYATLANHLTAHGDVLNAANEPTSGQFYVASAEAKALGMANGTGGGTTSLDGHVGFSTLAGTGYAWQFGATGTASNQYNLQSVVQHEITEVMGRTSMEGLTTYNGVKTYTPLDLFDFSANHTLALSNTGGYFSNDGGATQMGVFNNSAAYGGDIADWASYGSASQSGTVVSGRQDPFDAFTRPGYNDTLTRDDMLEMAVLGATLTPAGQAVA
jgi:hypothetical protein